MNKEQFSDYLAHRLKGHYNVSLVGTDVEDIKDAIYSSLAELSPENPSLSIASDLVDKFGSVLRIYSSTDLERFVSRYIGKLDTYLPIIGPYQKSPPPPPPPPPCRVIKEGVGIVKPPLGIKPEKIWKEERARDLTDCLSRNKDNIGSENFYKWTKELIELLEELRMS